MASFGDIRETLTHTATTDNTPDWARHTITSDELDALTDALIGAGVWLEAAATVEETRLPGSAIARGQRDNVLHCAAGLAILRAVDRRSQVNAPDPF